MTRFVTVLLLAFVVASVAPASAQTPAAATPAQGTLDDARRYFEQGLAMSDQERWGEAVEFLRRSLAIVERPSTLYNIGVAYLRVGKPTSARTSLERFLAVSDARQERARRAEATRLVAEANRAIARLTLAVDPPNARVLVDGNAVDRSQPVALDPGSHVVVVEGDGYERQSVEVSLLPGENLERRVVLAQTAAPAADPAVAAAPPVDAPTPASVAEASSPAPETTAPPSPFAPPPDRDDSQPFWKNAILWTVVGGVLVAGAVTAAVVVATSGESSPDSGSTGVVLSGFSF